MTTRMSGDDYIDAHKYAHKYAYEYEIYLQNKNGYEAFAKRKEIRKGVLEAIENLRTHFSDFERTFLDIIQAEGRSLRMDNTFKVGDHVEVHKDTVGNNLETNGCFAVVTGVQDQFNIIEFKYGRSGLTGKCHASFLKLVVEDVITMSSTCKSGCCTAHYQMPIYPEQCAQIKKIIEQPTSKKLDEFCSGNYKRFLGPSGTEKVSFIAAVRKAFTTNNFTLGLREAKDAVERCIPFVKAHEAYAKYKEVVGFNML